MRLKKHRVLWGAGAALAIVAFLSFGVPVWAFVLGLLAGTLLTPLVLDRLRSRRTAPPVPAPNPEEQEEHYDLKADTSTDTQRWLM
jgi:hypothetical protein